MVWDYGTIDLEEMLKFQNQYIQVAVIGNGERLDGSINAT
jgi:hypothetical protein